MAFTMEAGKLKEKVRFEKRIIIADGYGNEEGDWSIFCTRKCSLLPTRTAGGNEQVVSNRLVGTSLWDLVVYGDLFTKQVTEADQAIQILPNGDDGKVFNIRFIGDLVGNGRWLLMQLQEGVNSG